MRRIFWISVLVCGLSFSLSMADPEGRGKEVSKEKSTTQKKTKVADQAAEGHAFGKDQEKINQNGFTDKKNSDGLPPGHAKSGQVPPGQAKSGHAESSGHARGLERTATEGPALLSRDHCPREAQNLAIDRTIVVQRGAARLHCPDRGQRPKSIGRWSRRAAISRGRSSGPPEHAQQATRASPAPRTNAWMSAPVQFAACGSRHRDLPVHVSTADLKACTGHWG